MKLLLVQLSDIHLKDPEKTNTVLDRVDAIASAIKSVAVGVPACVVVVSGDSAFSGKKTEYVIARHFLEEILSKLGDAFEGGQIPLVVIAGNHDCDFALADQARSLLLSQVSSQQLTDTSVIEHCTEVQKHFVDFVNAARRGEGQISQPIDRLYRSVRLNIGGQEVVFQLLNSAWMSQLKEKPGTLAFPVEMLKEKLKTQGKSHLAVSVIHHPYNWFVPENARALRKCLEEHSDLILTGHEHDSQFYSKRKPSGEQNDYLEGGVLQESNDPSLSSFNVVIIDTDEHQQKSIAFNWAEEGYYEPATDPAWRPFERNKALLRNQFEINESFLREVEDPGANYTHPLKHPLTLNDIFVYPDLRELEYKRTETDRTLIHGRDFVSYILAKHLVLVSGDEKTGKTSLARTLFRDLQRSGKVPLLLKGTGLKGNIVDGNKLDKAIRNEFASQYSDGLYQRYLQLPKGSRAVIVDDFHKAGLNRKGKDRLATLLQDWFDVVVLMAGEEILFEEATDPGPEYRILWQFKHCELLPFGYALRNKLITQWHLLGRDYTEDENNLNFTIEDAEKKITLVLGTNLIPAFPVFLLILLQQLESINKLNAGTGSFGFLYEALVTASLAREVKPLIDIDTKYNYLTEHAYNLFCQKRRSLPEEEARAWHAEYCRTYTIQIDFGIMMKELTEAGIIDHTEGSYSFKYKYLYFLFVARYFSQHLTEPDIQERVKGLTQKLYHEASANIIIFLCHLSKDPLILETIFSAADSLYAQYQPVNLADSELFLNHLQSELPKLIMTDSDPSRNKQRLLEAQDAAENEEKDSGKKELSEVDPQEGDELTELLQLNASTKTIQILGQILRNFTGSLKGDLKLQLVKKCYLLGLRSLASLYSLVEKSLPELVEAAVMLFQPNDFPKSRNQLTPQVNRFICRIMDFLTFHIIRHVSDSVGTEKAAQTFADVLKEDANPSLRILDLSVKLDYYRRFPEEDILRLSSKFRKQMFPLTIVRDLVWYHLYLHFVDYKIRQRICEQLDISLPEKRKLLDSSPKRS